MEMSPQEKFISYGRILTLHYYFILMCIFFIHILLKVAPFLINIQYIIPVVHINTVYRWTAICQHQETIKKNPERMCLKMIHFWFTLDVNYLSSPLFSFTFGQLLFILKDYFSYRLTAVHNPHALQQLMTDACMNKNPKNKSRL